MDYESRVNALCSQVGATHKVLSDMPPEDARSDSISRVLETGAGTDENAYWTSLHELGHIAHDDSATKLHWYDTHPPRTVEEFMYGDQQGPNGFPLETTQKQEALAWDWALDNAGITPSPDAAATALFSLSSYNNRRGDRRAPLKDPAPEYLRTVERLTNLARGGKSAYSWESIGKAKNAHGGKYAN